MKRAGFTLIATLVTLALILFLAVYLMFGGRGGESSRKDGLGKTYPGAALARSHDAECIEHLRNNRLSLQIAIDSGGDEHPASLQDLKLPADFLHCPLGEKEPYVYDPQANDPKEAIKCVHPGHEKY